MNTIPERLDSITGAARHAIQDVKQTARESLLQPITDGTREVVHSAQSGCHAVAQSTSAEFQRIGSWAANHPTRAAGIVFAVGVLTGICLFRR